MICGFVLFLSCCPLLQLAGVCRPCCCGHQAPSSTPHWVLAAGCNACQCAHSCLWLSNDLQFYSSWQGTAGFSSFTASDVPTSDLLAFAAASVLNCRRTPLHSVVLRILVFGCPTIDNFTALGKALLVFHSFTASDVPTSDLFACAAASVLHCSQIPLHCLVLQLLGQSSCLQLYL